MFHSITLTSLNLCVYLKFIKPYKDSRKNPHLTEKPKNSTFVNSVVKSQLKDCIM